MNAFKFFAFALVLFFQASWVLAAATLMGVVRENQVGGSLVKGEGYKSLQESQRVAFDVTTGPKGQQASNISPN